jgi:hypothetical protein
MTVIPDKHTFTIWHGATFFEVLTLYETNDRTQPRDLTEYSAEMIIRKKPNDDTPSNIYLTLSTDGGTTDEGCSIVLQRDGATGQIELKIDADYTKIDQITWKSAVYDLTITSPSGITEALLYGGIKVNGV